MLGVRRSASATTVPIFSPTLYPSSPQLVKRLEFTGCSMKRTLANPVSATNLRGNGLFNIDTGLYKVFTMPQNAGNRRG